MIVTPEYNHSVPGGLKNAIDSVWVSFGFRNKPVAFVSYAGGQTGGVRAIEHLAHVFVETESVPVRNSVVIPYVREGLRRRRPAEEPRHERRRRHHARRPRLVVSGA